MRAPAMRAPAFRSCVGSSGLVGDASFYAIHCASRVKTRAHQIDEVVAVEAVLPNLVEPGDALLEAPERVPTALDVGIVGREEADLLARLLDDPADRLVRIGRHANLAAHVLARAELKPAETLLVPAEGADRRVELAHPARDPRRPLLDDADLEAREAFQDAVDDERRQHLHGWERDRHVVDRPEVLGAAVEVRNRRQPVLE